MSDTNSKILEKLEKQEKEEGKLPLLFEFYRRLVAVQSEAKRLMAVPGPILSKSAIDERISQGQPLLRFEDLKLDWPVLQDTFKEIAATFASYPDLFGGMPETLKHAERLLTPEAVRAWFEGTALPKPAAQISESLLSALIQATLKPMLESYAEPLLDSINQEGWRRRYCPVCGGTPDLAFLDQERGSRWLLCSRCDTRWLYQRLECPCCGTIDQNELSYYSDESDLYRLYVCDKCKRYLKAIDLRKAAPEVLIPLERVMTLDLDAQAREYGYSPCYGSAEAEKSEAG